MIEAISRPKKTITRSPAEASNSIPAVANKISVKNSPGGKPSSRTNCEAISVATIATIRIVTEKKMRIGSVTIIPAK
ncbi:MAG: hypothetical protein JMDDDDMK_00127 [Acidobacteria bacterium]|nr:hypothetical protein [Acidobacteriota bacterium]